VVWGEHGQTINVQTDDGLKHTFKMSNSQASMFNELLRTYTDLAM